jgi:ubiquinone/menaquinone biosynthesis C-methylase UbiE
MSTSMTEQTSALEPEMSTNPAATYEQYMVPPLFAPAAAQLLRTAQPRPGERVLDVGTGTGIVARRVAPHVLPGGTVVALDVSPAMLAVAQDVGEREGVAVDWREGVAEALPFPDGSFDLVLSQFALMFFVDRVAALREMRRVLTADGRLALSVFQGIERHSFYVALDEVIARRLGDSAVGAIFALGDADALRAEVARAGFREVAIEPFSVTSRFPNPEAFLAGEIDVDTAAIPAMQGLAPDARRELVAAIGQDMTGPLQTATEGDHVRLEFHAQIVHSRP